MGIRLKVVLILGALLVFLVSCTYIVFSKTVLQGFLDIESDHAKSDAVLVERMLQNENENIDTKLSDWAQWDDSYSFVETRDPAYVTSNISPAALGLLKIDTLLFFDDEKRLVLGMHTDADGSEQPVPEGLISLLADHPSILSFSASGESHQGIVILSQGPFLLAVRPIVLSDGSGPIRGALVFGRFLDDTFLERFSALVPDASIRFHVVRDGALSKGSDALVGGGNIAYANGEDEISGYALVRDILGDPALEIEVMIPRTLYQQGSKSITLFVVVGGLLGCGILLISLFLLDRFALSRITKLSKMVEMLRTKGVSSMEEISLPGKDEFSVFAMAMNDLLVSVRDSEKNLRRQAEELKKFQMAVEESFDVIIITDQAAKILYVNPSAERITGFSREEVIGKTPAVWGGKMSESYYTEFWKTIRIEKKKFFGEVINQKKGGESYVAELGVIPLLGDDGDVKFFVGVQRDITKQKQFEDELISQAKRLEIANELMTSEKQKGDAILRFLRSIGDGVIATDMDGRIIFANEAAEQLFACGCELEGQRHSDVFQVVSEKDVNREECFIKDVLEMRKNVEGRNHRLLVRNDGTKIPVSYTADPIRGADGTMIGCIAVMKDITEEREMESMKDRFLSVSAHQLRTPLSGMRWSMEMILGDDLGKLPKKVKDMLERVHANTVRMITLVGDLLDVSRINEGNYVEEALPTDIVPLAKEVLEAMSSDAEDRQVRLMFDKEESLTLPEVFAAPKKLYEVIENLISNAVKYTDAGGTVTMAIRPSAGGVTLSVADDGIGIPKREQEKIFSKFFRASNAMRKNTDGSGLGLSVVKSFVEEIGGRVWFESEEGVGATFFIEIPTASNVRNK